MIGAPVGIRTRVAGMKTRNDGPYYTTGATTWRGLVKCMNGSVASLLFIEDFETFPPAPCRICK